MSDVYSPTSVQCRSTHSFLYCSTGEDGMLQLNNNSLVPNNIHGGLPGGGRGGTVTYSRRETERSPLLQKDTVITIDYVGVGPVVPSVGFSCSFLFFVCCRPITWSSSLAYTLYVGCYSSILTLNTI